MTQVVTPAPPPLSPQPRLTRFREMAARRSEVAGFHWWVIVAAFLLAAVYFHSKTDPGQRFAFKQGDPNYGPAWFEVQQFGPFTPADVATVAFLYLAVMRRLTYRMFTLSKAAFYFTILVAIAIASGVVVGISNNTASPFGDWRDLLMGAVFAFCLWSTVLRSEEGCFRFAQVFVGVITWYAADQLFAYLHGGGEIAFYGRTPDSDHATLEFMVAATALSLAMLRTGRTRWLWGLGILLPSAVVVLGFRRYAWVELGIVFGVFLLLSGRNRGRYIAGIAVVAIAAALAIAVSWNQLQWSERFASLDPWASKQDNALAATNQSHIDDILDGWDQVSTHPILGLGVGVTYIGQRTFKWKGTAGMVHNGPIEIWIKFGVLGMALFFLGYLLIFRSVWKRRHGNNYSDWLAWGAGSFLLANFVITCTIYAWPYAVWEKSVLVFSMIALCFPATRERLAQRSPQPEPEP